MAEVKALWQQVTLRDIEAHFDGLREDSLPSLQLNGVELRRLIATRFIADEVTVPNRRRQKNEFF